METIFENLQSQGQNSVDGLIEWMKEVKIVDGVKVTAEKVMTLFDGIDPSSVDLDNFKDVLSKLAADTNQSVDEFFNKLRETEAAVAKAAEELATVAQANSINATDPINAEASGLSTSSEEPTKKTEDIVKMLAKKGPKLMSAFGAAANAFSSAMKK